MSHRDWLIGIWIAGCGPVCSCSHGPAGDGSRRAAVDAAAAPLDAARGVAVDAAAPEATPGDARPPRLFEYEPIPPPLPDDFACEPTLESIRDNIFEKSCQWDTCHSGNGAAWGLKLVLDVDAVFADLVSHEAASCMGWQRVVPGSPEQSFLWNKLTATVPACGEHMPWGFGPLPDAALACIRDWIAALPSAPP